METSSMNYTDIRWNVTKDHQRMVFKIPVKNLIRKKWWQFWIDEHKESEKKLRDLMKDYTTDLKWDGDELFMPENNSQDLRKAYEVIYDKDSVAIGMKELNPDTLTKSKSVNGHYHTWIQYNDDPALRRILFQSQVLTNF